MDDAWKSQRFHQIKKDQVQMNRSRDDELQEGVKSMIHKPINI